jgi:hypothetical protein
MFIPDKFQLGAHTVSVLKDVPLKEAWGEWNNETKTMRLRKPSKRNPDTFYYQTFVHELVHAVLDTMGREELSKDESFVDGLSEMLTQAVISSEYPKDADGK